MAHGAREASRRLTPDQLATWRAFIETAELVRSVLGGRLQAGSGLSMGDYAVLLSLKEAAGNRLRSSALAADVGWERSRLSHHLSRMERRGLVRREDCADDSRGAEVVATADGLAAFRRASIPHLRDVQELFIEALTPAQLAALDDVVVTVRAHIAART